MRVEYLMSRFLQAVLVIVLASMVTFVFLAVLPGDPISQFISSDNVMTDAQLELARERLGLNRPLPIQYLSWAGNLLTGDWGTSIRTGQPVLVALGARAPVTLYLAALATALALVIAIPAGVIAAINRNRWIDRLATLGALVGVAIPNVWLGLLMILMFSVYLGWLPPSGYVRPTEDFVGFFQRMIMPAFVLGTAQAATIARQMRSSMLEVLGQDYVRTARAKGLSERTVIMTHAFRNALLPVITVLGLRLGSIIGGSVVVETIFALPGMGRLAIQGIFANDYPVTMGFVLLVAAAVSLANFATDIAYGVVDPRIQLGRAGERA